jgi:hypothetical protein
MRKLGRLKRKGVIVIMEKRVIIMTLEKETKGTYRYKEELSGQPEVIGLQYIRKWAVGTPPPQKIQLTIEEVK